MKATKLFIACLALCALLIWLGLDWVRAEMPSTAPSTELTTAPSTELAIAPSTELTTAPTTTPSTTPSTAPSNGPGVAPLASSRPMPAMVASSAPVRPLSTMPALATTRPVQPPIAANPPSSGGGFRSLTMPREYSLLLTRSMFVPGHMAEAGHVGGTYRPPSRNEGPSAADALRRSENSLVFNGVTQTDKKIDALVEDTTTGRVMTVHPGDAIARGTVGRITFDTLEYVSGGRTTLVHIGENMTGGEGDVSSSPATTAPSASGLSPEDILKRLAQRRMQEQGGGK